MCPHFTFAVHPHLQTLEQAAVLAAVALLARHLAVLVAAAAVHTLVPDAALEEALAALAGDDAIVQACGAVSTDKASTLVSWIICRGTGKRKKTEAFRTISTHFFTLIHPHREEKKWVQKPRCRRKFLIEIMGAVGA